MIFPILKHPDEDAPDIVLGVGTVFLEAEAEQWLGKLAVAYVIVNRATLSALSLRAVILGRDLLSQGDARPFEAFSCWNDSDLPRSLARLARVADSRAWVESWSAMAAAYWRFRPDPSAGADHYLNVDLTRQIRGGTLPSWYDDRKISARIGAHTFLRLA